MTVICKKKAICLATYISLLLLCSSALGRAPHEYSAVWYDPARSGQGWIVEILSESFAAVTWYTFDDSGNQRWLYGTGPVSADGSRVRVSVAQLMVTSGGRFGSSFDPTRVSIDVVGSLAIEFDSCDSATVSYEAFGHAEMVPVMRLSSTMSTGCAFPALPVDHRVTQAAGQSGSWYDPSHSGEGFQLQWTSRGEALLTWYTYDRHGNQRWLVGVGRPEGDAIHFPVLQLASGGIFGPEFDPTTVQRVEWGALTLSLGCASGIATYTTSHPDFEDGSQSVVPLTRAVSGPCPWAPRLFSELYRLEFSSLFLGNPPLLSVKDVADDGSVSALLPETDGGFQLSLQVARDEPWQQLSGPKLSGSLALFSQGSVVANQFIADGTFSPQIWAADSGWQPLPFVDHDRSLVTGFSQDRSNLVGYVGPFQVPWKWSLQGGQVLLPIDADSPAAFPTAASDDGRTVVGATVTSPAGLQLRAVRWIDDLTPEIMRDAAGRTLRLPAVCNRSCTYVFGGGQERATSDTASGQAWIWHSNGTEYLGELDDASSDSRQRYFPVATSVSGSLLAGNYHRQTSTGAPEVQGFIWTRLTGLKSLSEILTAAHIAITWEQIEVRSVSPDGRQVLIAGFERPPGPGSIIPRAGVVTIVPLDAMGSADY